ncbi:MAG: motility associated factor glycosyltransferase family protein, partial [Planctomycetota bacterium]
FAGDPAIVISAGPSLSRNIDQLAELKGRAVLCAVQTTLRPLIERGIVPDFVTSLDFHEMSRKFFEGVDHLEDTHLVAEPKATWHVIDDYPGPVSLLDNAWARMVIGDHLAARGGLQAGATVAHLAFYLAVYMGCDPIIFVGQDLAFTGHVFYVPGVEIHRAWQSEINRFNTMEQKEWDRIVRNRPILRRVPGVDGGELYTDDLLLTYLEQFETDIAAVPGRVINATEGGARIRGTDTMTLCEATERFCIREIDPQRFAYRHATTWRNPAKLEATWDQLQQRVLEFDEVVEVCDELLKLLEELKGLTHDPERFNKRLIRVDELRTKVHQGSRGYEIVNAATQLAEFRRFKADRLIGAGELEDVERAKLQIDRDIEFVTGVRDGAIDVKPILTEAFERVEAAMKTA